LTAPQFYDSQWTVLGGRNKRTSVDTGNRGDITATGNVVWAGNWDHQNPRVATDRPLIITVGGDLHIGGAGSGAPSSVTYAMGNQWDNGDVTGNVLVLVLGNIYVHNEVATANRSQTVFYSVGSGGSGSLSNTTIHRGAGSTSLSINGTSPSGGVTTQSVESWLTARLNPTNNMAVWNMSGVTYANTLAIDWSENGNITATQRGTLNSRYGINVTGLNNIWYIDENTIINHPIGAGGQRILLIDTGLNANTTVHVQLGISGTFRWNPSGQAQDQIAVMTLGNGSVVFHVPDAVTYCTSGLDYPARNRRTGTGTNVTSAPITTGQSRVYIGPFNLAVARNTTNTNWTGCSRLGRFMEAANAQTAAAWLNSLLQHEGSGAGLGVLRGDIGVAGPGPIASAFPTNPAGSIAMRSHANPLNMNVFLVYNGTGELNLRRGTDHYHFFAGSVYAYRGSVVAGGSGNGDNLTLFGSIAGKDVNVDVMDHIIAMMPGGGSTTTTTTGTTTNPPSNSGGDLTDLPVYGRNPDVNLGSNPTGAEGGGQLVVNSVGSGSWSPM
jgi:hypothetical protein